MYGPLHRLRLLRLVGQLVGLRQGGQLGRALDHVGQDQQPAEPRRQEGAERVQRLRQGQPAGAGLLRSEQGDIGIGRHLQHGDAGGQHEQCAEEGRIQMQAGGGPEAQRADAGNGQPGHDAFLVAQRGDQPPGRHRHQEVRAEEGELHQHHLRIAELEAGLQVRDQDVVEAGQEAPHEEDRGQHAHRQRMGGVAGAPGAGIRRGRKRGCSKSHGVFRDEGGGR